MGNERRPARVSDLKPFSVDDPLGERNRAQVDARHRREDAAAASASHAQPATAVAPPARVVAAPRQPKKKSGGSGCGCASLGCLLPFVLIPLVIFGVMASAVPTFWDMFQAWQLESSGTGIEVAARVVSVEGTNSQFNEETIWKLSLEIHPQDDDPYEVSLERALADADAEDLSEAGWVKVLVDPEDPEIVALSDPPYNPSDASVLPVEDPTAEPNDAATADDATADNATADNAAADDATADNATADDATDDAAADDAAVDDAPKELAPICRQTYECCVIIQDGRTQGCDSFLTPLPTTEHCSKALPLYRKVGLKVRRPCAP